MEKIWQKGCAMVLASFMVMTALAVFATPVLADEYAARTGGRMGWNIHWVDYRMADDPAVDAEDEKIIFNYDGENGNMYYLGDDESSLSFRLWSSGWDTTAGGSNGIDNDGTWVNVTLVDGNATDAVKPGDDYFRSFNGLWTNDSYDRIYFTVDIANNGTVEKFYPLTVRISYRNETMAPTDAYLIDTIGIDIYVSSVFHDDDGDDSRDMADTLTYDGDDGSWDWDKNFLKDDGGDFGFEPGDTFEDGLFEADFDAPFDMINTMLTLTPPTGGNITYAANYAQSMGRNSGNIDFNYRVNVAPQTPAGIYHGTAALGFTRDDHGYNQNIVEGARSYDVCVDYTYADRGAFTRDDLGNWYSEYAMVATEVNITDIGEVIDDVTPTNDTGNTTGNGTRQIDIFELPSDTYEQSTFSDKLITFDVTIQNNGNTELFNVEFYFDPQTGTPGEWDYFRNPNFFYDSWDMQYDTARMFIESFPVGAEETFTIQATVVKEIPVGEHRLPIFYTGYYFDAGVLLTDTDFVETDEYTVYFSIFVTDGQMDCKVDDVWTPNNNYGTDDTTDIFVNVDIWNLEGYAFIDVIATADFTGTPFYDPMIGQSANRIIPAEQTPWDYWGPIDSGWDEMDLDFWVDMQTDLTPDKYPFTITLVAIIETTLEEVTTTIPATLVIEGYGPRIWIEAFATSEIKAGNYFDLNLTVTNSGDDDLRDTWAYIGADGVEPAGYLYDEVICNVIGQIQRESEEFNGSGDFLGEEFNISESYTWDGAEVTLEDLDIDSAKEIVALNLYIDGVYSSPSAVITLLYIGTIAAGESVQVDYQMMADKDMVDGKPYVITVEVWGIDSEGNGYDMGEGYGVDITVKTAKEGAGSYNPVETDYFMGGMQIMGLVLFIIIVIAILFYVLRRVVFPPKKEQPPVPPQ
ncbi:MAG: hypothetical protein V1934_00320 [Methanobacteriota archaeon]